MYPRDKLHQCFGCEHRFECWGLLENYPLGKNEKTVLISPWRTLKFLLKHSFFGGKLSAGEFYGMISYSLMAGIGQGRPNRRDTYLCIFLLAALSNSSNDGWTCPGEDENDEVNFMYTPVRPD